MRQWIDTRRWFWSATTFFVAFGSTRVLLFRNSCGFHICSIAQGLLVLGNVQQYMKGDAFHSGRHHGIGFTTLMKTKKTGKECIHIWGYIN